MQGEELFRDRATLSFRMTGDLVHMLFYSFLIGKRETLGALNLKRGIRSPFGR